MSLAQATTPRRILLAVYAAGIVGTLGLNTVPMVVGASIDSLQLSEIKAGLLASVELGMMALTSLLLAHRVARTSMLRLGILGAIITALGHFGPALIPAHKLVPGNTDSYYWILIFRTIAGFGEGFLLTVYGAVIATSHDPERVHAKAMICNVLAAGVLMVVLIPAANQIWGFKGLFIAITLMILLFTPFLKNLPTLHGKEPSHQPLPNKRLGLMMLASIAVYATGEGAMWAFTERMANAAHVEKSLTSSYIGFIFSTAAISGCLITHKLGNRFGRIKPCIYYLIAYAILSLSLSYTNQPSYFLPLLYLQIASLYVVLPYYMGVFSILDRKGRYAAASGGMYLLGNTVGPVLAGSLIQDNYQIVGWVAFVSTAIALLLLIPPTLATEAKGYVVAE